jgi:rhodanese-related sulfurtransferase
MKKEIAVLCLIAAFIGMVFNAFSPKGIPLLRTEPPKEVVADTALFGRPAVDTAAPATGGAYRTISLDQFKRLLTARRGILLDARNEDEYVKGHVPGARNVPGQNPDPSFEHLAQIPRDSLVIVYCNNPDCHLGRMLIDFMKVLGFTDMVLYDDGWDGWVAAREPVDSTAVAW